MNSMTGEQLELLAASSAPEQQAVSGGGLLGLILDEIAFLDFLSNEWIIPPTGYLLLGTQQACGANLCNSSAVGIWFDVQLLPDCIVMAWRDGAWVEKSLRNLTANDTFVSWGGPLPAFSVDHFRVSSDAAKTKLLALARNFGDMEIPSQPFKVGAFSPLVPPKDAPQNTALGYLLTTGMRCEVLRQWLHSQSPQLIHGLNYFATSFAQV